MSRVTNFSMYSGNSRKLTVYVTDKSGKRIDMSNYKAIKWVLKQKGRLLCTKELNQGIVLTEPTEGRLDITLDPEDTDNRYGECEHCLVITDELDGVYTVLTGYAVLNSY